MKTWFSPKPPDLGYRLPRWFPTKTVPSYIGDVGQVLNILMHEGAGAVAQDYSGYRNHGAIARPEWVDGEWGWAVNFNGVNDIINCGSNLSLDNIAEFTFLSWLYPIGAVSSARIFSKTRRYLCRVGVWRLSALIDAVTDATADTNEALTTNRWNFVTLTYSDSGDRMLYIDINNVPCTYSTQVAAVGALVDDSAVNLCLGNLAALNRCFPGYMGPTRIYSRVLPAVERTEKFESTRSIFGV